MTSLLSLYSGRNDVTWTRIFRILTGCFDVTLSGLSFARTHDNFANKEEYHSFYVSKDICLLLGRYDVTSRDEGCTLVALVTSRHRGRHSPCDDATRPGHPIVPPHTYLITLLTPAPEPWSALGD